jgi:hypothetical protein
VAEDVRVLGEERIVDVLIASHSFVGKLFVVSEVTNQANDCGYVTWSGEANEHADERS